MSEIKSNCPAEHYYQDIICKKTITLKQATFRMALSAKLTPVAQCLYTIIAFLFRIISPQQSSVSDFQKNLLLAAASQAVGGSTSSVMEATSSVLGDQSQSKLQQAELLNMYYSMSHVLPQNVYHYIIINSIEYFSFFNQQIQIWYPFSTYKTHIFICSYFPSGTSSPSSPAYQMVSSPSFPPINSPGSDSGTRSRHTSNDSTGSFGDQSSTKPFRPKNELERQQYKEHRRASHISAEQKRRCNIKTGFDLMHQLVPSLSQNPNAKVSKAATLQKGKITAAVVLSIL